MSSPPPPPSNATPQQQPDATSQDFDNRDNNKPGSERFCYKEEDLAESQTLFFGGLPGNITEQELRTDMLGDFTIDSVKMGVPKKGPEGTKYAFVSFTSREEAKESYHKFNGKNWRDFQLKVDWDVGLNKKQEANKRSGYGQRRDDRGRYGGPRGSYGGGGRRGGYGAGPGGYSRSGSRRPSYGYRGAHRYAPYGGSGGGRGDYSRRDYDAPPRGYDSYGGGGGSYDRYESRGYPPSDPYYGGGGSYDRYPPSYRDAPPAHDRGGYDAPPPAHHAPASSADYDRYPPQDAGYGAPPPHDSYGRGHSPRGGAPSGGYPRDQGYAREYDSRDAGYGTHPDAGRGDYSRGGGAPPAEYDYPPRDDAGAYGER